MADTAVPDKDNWLGDIILRVKDPIGYEVNKATAAEIATNAQVQQAAHGPGIYLDRDHAEQMVKQAGEILAALENDQSLTQSLERMQSAAQDPVSVGFTKAATWNGGQPGAFAYGAGHVRLEILYLGELTRRLEKALGRTSENDHESGKGLGGIAQEGDY
ncbi:hypothetical protein ACFWMR_10470 [Amycolatopsis thailandensis]|uniref:hypothetical protein n=1 Tax=Amycolatopsis thailandensis TaxID=589330 RepID=UPI003651B87B